MGKGAGRMNEIRMDIKSCILSLTNTKRNQVFLDKVIHKEFFDMSIVYRQIMGFLEFDRDRIASIGISYEMLERERVAIRELEKAAYQTTFEAFPAEMGMREEGHYVVSNYLHYYGATAMLDNTFLEEAAKTFGEGFYIIPTNIDRIDVIAESKAEPKELAEILARWNESQEGYEILSDNIYYYDRMKKKIEVACANETNR